MSSQWYNDADFREVSQALGSLRRPDRSQLDEEQIECFARAIDIELDLFRDRLSADISDLIALLPPDQQQCQQHHLLAALADTDTIRLRLLARLRCELLRMTGTRTPQGRLRRDLDNLSHGATSLRALLSPKASKGRGRPMTVARTYKRELVLALRVGARRAGVVEPDQSRMLVTLDRDHQALTAACMSAMNHWMLRGHREDFDTQLQHLQFGLLRLYEQHLKKPAAFSYYKPESKPERPGPTMRYLSACLAPLSEAPTLDSCRRLVRRYRRLAAIDQNLADQHSDDLFFRD